MNKNRLLAWSFALLACLTASAFELMVDGIYYSTTDGGVTVTGFKSNYTGDLVLNGTVTYDGTEYDVVYIGYHAFQHCTKSIIVGDLPACTGIGYGAFYGCSSLTSVGDLSACTSIEYQTFSGCGSLTSVGDLTACTSIGESAFLGCSSLTSVGDLPACTSIGNYAFNGCGSLTSITIPASVKDIDPGTFFGCDGLVNIIVADGNSFYDSRNNCNAIIETASNTLIVGCKGTIIPDGVTNIGDYAFHGSCISNINIPNSVVRIGNNAFDSCRELAGITIPNSVTSIGKEAFRCCSSLTNINLSQNITTFEENTFYESGLTSIVIPEGVTSIGVGAFSRCFNLTAISLPNNVTSIDDYAFSETGLTSLVLPESLISIGNQAFYDCWSLHSIVIPKNVSSIGTNVFEAGGGLERIKVDSENTTYDSRENCNAIIETATNTLIAGCQNTIIPNSVTGIGDDAFYAIPIESIVIPEGVTSIGNNVFVSCPLTSVTLPSSLTSIGNTAFYGTPIQSIVIPEGVTSISDGLFVHCHELTSVVIPESVTSIGDGAFADCNSLIGITIPESVTSIGDGAFEGCTSLDSIVCYAVVPPACGPNTFLNVHTSTCFIEVPDESLSAYQEAEYWEEFHIYAISTGTKKCATPTITYANGKIKLQCETEGATYYCSITPAGNPSGFFAVPTGEATLSKQYVITAYAIAQGYRRSESATLTITPGDGDLNGDGETNVSDVTRLVSIILGSENE